MNYGGDIPNSHRELVKALQEQEKWFKEHKEVVSKPFLAKAYVCMAHDYYGMDMEEVGQNLFLKAEFEYPNYFKEEIFNHMAEDADFYKLVGQLKEFPEAISLMRSWGFGK